MADKPYGGDKPWGRYGDVEIYPLRARKGNQRFRVNQKVGPKRTNDHTVIVDPEGQYSFGGSFLGNSHRETQDQLTRSEHFMTALTAARGN